MTNQKRGSAKLFHKAKKKWDPTHGAPKQDASHGEDRGERTSERKSIIKRPLRSKVARRSRPGLYEPTESQDPRGMREAPVRAMRADAREVRPNPHDREPRSVREARARADATAAKESAAPEKPAPRPLPGAVPLNPSIAAFQALRQKALSYPSTYEDKELGQTLIKLKNKNVVISLGREGGGLQLTAKLPKSGLSAVSKFSWAEGASHGLARKGWVTASFAAHEAVPLRMLIGWVEESHGAVMAPPKSARP